MNRAASTTKGFTLVELMLAMTFIAVLLLAIAMTVIQIGTIYNKGMTVKDINQAGRSIGEDLSREAAKATMLNLPTDLRQNSAGGRLCFGTYSYVWNTTRAIGENPGYPTDALLTRYESNARTIRLVKVPDSARIYCSVTSGGALVYPNIRAADTNQAQEMLPEGDHKLGLNRFSIIANSAVIDTTTQQGLYTAEYTIGSGPLRAMTTDQSSCLDPSNANSDIVYCSVQPFTLVLRTGNRG